MKKLKVTVSGMVDNVFVGTDKEVEKYLIELKKIQDANVEVNDMKEYKKNYKNANWDEYYKPSYRLEKFREKYKPSGLSIKIEPFQPEPNPYF